MTRWAKWFTKNCARNLTIRTNGIYTTQILSWRMRDTTAPLGFWDTADHLISARRPNLEIIDKKKRTCRIVDFADRADHRVKLKKSEKKDRHPDLVRKLKKTVADCDINCNWFTWYSHQRTGSRTGGLGNKRTSALLRSTRILRRVLETWGDLPSLRLQWKTIGLYWYEKLDKEWIIIKAKIDYTLKCSL